jgi:general nucleoside transport system permease protein
VDLLIILQAGVASGTVLLFATIGEIFSERAGVLNLGVEGMMLIGAMAAFSVTVATGNGWLGMLMAMVVAGLLALLHGVVTIHFQADQVVSGLALTFLGVGLSLVFGEGLSKAGTEALRQSQAGGFMPWERLTIPLLSVIPILGRIFFTDHSVMVYLGYLMVPATWYYINRTRPGLHLRAVGDNPTAADSMGLNVYRLRYLYVVVGGMLAGLAGGTISLVASPGWFSELTTSGQGWIAVGLVIFAQWDPFRAAFGAYAFGTLRRLILDIQGPATIFGLTNPFFINSYLGFFLAMLPYAFTILVLVIGSREALRKRLGAPAALGNPYIRGERGN